ncbi:unnamed protein product [Malus baccata var. baccata]
MLEKAADVRSLPPCRQLTTIKVSMLFAKWYWICELPGADAACAHLRTSLCRCSLCPFANFLVPMQLAACAHFILQLHQSGLLKGNDMTDRFFCVFTELSVAYCLSSEMTIPGSVQTPQQVQNIFFLAIDIYAKLVFLILKGSSKLFLLSKILAITVGFIQMDAEEKKTSFNRRSYFR